MLLIRTDFGSYPMPELPLCLGVLKYRTRWPGRPHLPAKKNYNGSLLMWCNFKFEGVLFRSNSIHDRVYSLWECVTKQAQVRVLIT